MSKYFTRDSRPSVTVFEDYSKKLVNFQLVPPLSVEQQIERFTTSGKDLLKAAGLGVYDFNENQPLDDSIDDPTRDPDFDLIDAAVARRDALLRIQAAIAAGTATPSSGEHLQKPLDKNSVDKSNLKSESATNHDAQNEEPKQG